MNKHECIHADKRDGRQWLIFVDENNKHSSKSYPRILMEKKLGRPLEPKFGTQEQFRRNSEAECGLNGEPSPNGNTVPNEEQTSSCA